MKRLKLYASICLIISMIVLSCPAVFASGAVEYGLSWIINPIVGVTGEIYSDSPFGFIIRDYENSTTALVNENGVVLPNSEKNFSYIEDCGLINFYTYGEDYSSQSGVMDISGNIIFPASEERSIYILNEERFVSERYTDEGPICGIIDREGNEIVPFEYEYMYWWGTVLAYGKDNSVTVFDSKGNLVKVYDNLDDNISIQSIPAEDRYLISTYNNGNETRIIHIDGTELAVVPYELSPISSTVLRGIENYDGGMKLYYHDYDGNLLRVEDQKDFMGNNGVSYTFSDAEEGYTLGYVDGVQYVVDENGNIVCEPPVKNPYSICKNALIKYTDDDYNTHGIVDFNGNVIVPLGIYDTIYYSEGLDQFAFSKDGQISIGRINPVTVTVKGNPVEFDQNPVVKEGRTLVPVRAIFEALGATVEWEASTQTVTATLGNIVVKLVINSNTIDVNGTKVTIDVPAEIMNGRTLVPVRAISESFGCDVQWDGSARCVVIQ